MQFIDTHTHLYLPEFDTDRDEVVSRAVGNGIVKMLLPNIDLQSVDQILSAVNRYPGICYPMTGLHPVLGQITFERTNNCIQKTNCICI